MLSFINMAKRGKSLVMFLLSQLIIIIIFAIIYWLIIAKADKEDVHFRGLTKKSPLIDFIYYSITTQTTVGYGDITPVSKLAKILAMVQMAMIYLGIGLTEHEIMKYLAKKGYWQPLLLIAAFIIAAFAPPILSVFIHVFRRKDGVEASPAIFSLARQMVKKSIHGKWF